MPTGYTDKIKDGITFKEYAMGCARAFGALIMMRDDPADTEIPEQFEPLDYHLTALETAKRELEYIKVLDSDTASRTAQAEYDAEANRNDMAILKDRDLMLKYGAMLEQVKAYKSPTPDHDDFKEFMKSQIESSVKFDGMEDYYNKNRPVLLPGEAWRAKKIRQAEHDIEYHTKNYAEEVARTNGRNEWVTALRGSLEC